MEIEKVTQYIKENIFNSDNFEQLTEDKQIKAIKSAQSKLYLMFTSYKPESNPISIQAIAYQTLWEIDVVQARPSEVGIASQSIEGMTQTFRGMDRTIAPEVRRLLRSRVGRYHLPVFATNRGKMLHD